MNESSDHMGSEEAERQARAIHFFAEENAYSEGRTEINTSDFENANQIIDKMERENPELLEAIIDDTLEEEKTRDTLGRDAYDLLVSVSERIYSELDKPFSEEVELERDREGKIDEAVVGQVALKFSRMYESKMRSDPGIEVIFKNKEELFDQILKRMRENASLVFQGLVKE